MSTDRKPASPAEASVLVGVVGGIVLILVGFIGAALIAKGLPAGTAAPYVLTGLVGGVVFSALVLTVAVRRARRGAQAAGRGRRIGAGIVMAGAGAGMLLDEGPGVAVLLGGGVFFLAVLGLIVAEHVFGWTVRSAGDGDAPGERP